jgi:chaperonin GroEL
LALQNAASIAGLLLTTECVVGKVKEKDNQPQGMGGMMGM